MNRLTRMRARSKVLIGLAAYLGITVATAAIFGSAGKNAQFAPQDEYKLQPWIALKLWGVDLSVNRAVLYLVLASGLTIASLTWISRRMQAKPNRVQTLAEVGYELTRRQITGGNMDGAMAARWFPFVATLFFWIWFSNTLGYLPLPTNTQEEVQIFGLAIPSFALYAATANISISLALTLVVWLSYHVEGIRVKGFVPYFASWLPAGLDDMNPLGKAAIFLIEVISHFVRLVSLSVRLFANVLAGHLLLLFMGGGLAVLLGLAALGALAFPLAFVFYVFELGLVATLQAFIFATLSAIYIGEATAVERH